MRGWLDELRLRAWSVHAPICEGFRDGVWGRAVLERVDRCPCRDEAVAETIGRPWVPRASSGPRWWSSIWASRSATPSRHTPTTRRPCGASLEPIADACGSAGVRLALEVIPNALATPPAVPEWLEGDLELGRTGACLDVGHAHLTGGAPEAVERLGGHIITTHIHDNRGRTDDHLVPFDGTIDWTATLVALSKVGYAGPLDFRVA